MTTLSIAEELGVTYRAGRLTYAQAERFVNAYSCIRDREPQPFAYDPNDADVQFTTECQFIDLSRVVLRDQDQSLRTVAPNGFAAFNFELEPAALRDHVGEALDILKRIQAGEEPDRLITKGLFG